MVKVTDFSFESKVVEFSVKATYTGKKIPGKQNRNIPYPTAVLYLIALCLSDGYTYERAAITGWISSGKTRSPMTNGILPSTELTPNRSLKMLIQRLWPQPFWPQPFWPQPILNWTHFDPNRIHWPPPSFTQDFNLLIHSHSTHFDLTPTHFVLSLMHSDLFRPPVLHNLKIQICCIIVGTIIVGISGRLKIRMTYFLLCTHWWGTPFKYTIIFIPTILKIIWYIVSQAMPVIFLPG